MGNFVVSGVLARDVYADHLSKLSEGRSYGRLKGSIQRELKSSIHPPEICAIYGVFYTSVQVTSSNVVI